MERVQISEQITILLDPRPDRMSCKIDCTYSHGGSWYEESGDEGRRHLLEHCLVARTKILDDIGFKEYCYRFNISYNAFTSPAVIQINGRSHREDAKKVIELFAELCFEPTFDETILTKEREIVLREISERIGEADYTLWKETSDETFVPGSYERHEVLGSYDTVASTTLEDLKRIYKTLSSKGHIIITVSGAGFDNEMIKNIFTKYSTAHSAELLSLPHTFANTLSQTGFRSLYHALGHQEGSLTVYIPTIITHLNRSIRTLFADLVLGWNGTGLYDYLRDELGLVYGYHYTYEQSGDFLKLELTGELGLVTKILGAVEEFLSKCAGQISEDKFLIAKQNMIKKFEQARDSLGFDSNFVLDSLLYFGVNDTSEDYVKRTQAISVEDLRGYCTTVHEAWKISTALVTSRDLAVKNLTYGF